MKVLAVFLLVHLFPGATPYSMGPPLGACAEMFPTGHGVAAQESLPPFDILVNATSYKVGDVIESKCNACMLVNRSLSTTYIMYHLDLKLIQKKFVLFTNSRENMVE